MSVVKFQKPPTSVQKALQEFKDSELDTVLIVGRSPDKQLVWTFGGEATISEAVGLLEVLKHEIISGEA